MPHELTKREKKIARDAIDKGLNAQYKEALEKAGSVITEWRSGQLGNQDAYGKLYKEVKENDYWIGRRYNDMRGSMYLRTVIDILYDGYISEEDIKDFSDETKARIMESIAIAKKFAERE
jgi:predicted DNA-binding ArsR family transcriptional regulator